MKRESFFSGSKQATHCSATSLVAIERGGMVHGQCSCLDTELC